MATSTGATTSPAFADRCTARERAPSWRGNAGPCCPGTAGAPPLSPVAVRRPNDTGCFNPARQIGPRRSPASSFVAAVPGEHEQQYLRSEEHTSELQSRQYLVCRLLLEKKKSSPSAPS